MGKKTKKNRFNTSLDVNVVYSTNAKADGDPADHIAELNISNEKAEEIQRIRAKLPTFSQGPSLESELAKLPDREPFRAFVHNVAFSATEENVAEFFAPLSVTNINMVSCDSGSRGFCFVDFATRDDLAKALLRSDAVLAGRCVNVRIAMPGSNDRGGGSGYSSRDRGSYGGTWQRGDAGSDKRRAGGYRPASLRDDPEESSEVGPWKRGAVVATRTSTTTPASSYFGDRGSAPAKPSQVNEPTGVNRPKLNLLPRTNTTVTPGKSAWRDPKIFGDAKPVDTSMREKEVAQRLNAQSTAVE